MSHFSANGRRTRGWFWLLWDREGHSLFTDAAAKHFGSGWAFLVVNPSTERLEIMSLPDQDSVLLHGKVGLLCCDVWEHAYYLKYRNRRPDYLHAWWNVVAWHVVDQRLQDWRTGKSRL